MGALQLCDHDSSVSQLCFAVECSMVAVGTRPPWGCLCGEPQWDQQRNIMKHEPVASTHLEGWLLSLRHLIRVDKRHLVGFRNERHSVVEN